MSDTYKFTVQVPSHVSLPDDLGKVDRAEFFDWLWGRFSEEGLVGVHEGTLLSEEAAEQGLETDSWTVDSGEAPRERDWVGQQEEGQAELYFSTQKEAETAFAFLKQIPELKLSPVELQKDEDWDANWKASFLNEGKGVPVAPFWKIVPPWVKDEDFSKHEKLIRINPGAGFGTGTHETTQLCLQAIGEYSEKRPVQGTHALDFGSGSGILSISLAQLGASVDAVEIDELAIDNACENASLNQVKDQIVFSKELKKNSGKYPWVIANILRPVLLEFSEKLVDCLALDGILILSGLIESDVPSVIQAYSQLLRTPVAQVYEKGEWRALVFVRQP